MTIRDIIFSKFAMKNQTISGLTLSKILNSPVFSMSESRHNTINMFRNVKVSYSASNFLYSKRTNLNLQISNSHFNKFLDNCIVLEKSISIVGQNKPNYRQTFYNNVGYIRDSSFHRCLSPNKNGSAIYSEVPVSLYNCLLSDCKGRFGGALYTSSELIATFCTFLRNSAGEQAGAITIRSTNEAANISDSIFAYNKANDLFGCIYRHSDGEFGFVNINFTHSHANSCVGGLEISRGPMYYNYVMFASNSANVHNGCCVIRDPDSFEMHHTTFYNNSHTSSDRVAAAALLAYGLPKISRLIGCNFIKNQRSESLTLKTYYGQSLYIINCTIDEDIGYAVSDEPKIKAKNFEMIEIPDFSPYWSASKKEDMIGYQIFRVIDDVSKLTFMNIVLVVMFGFTFALLFSFILIKAFDLLFIIPKHD